MPRERLCKACRGWHALDAWPVECLPAREAKRAGFPVPMLAGDSMPETQSMVDGRYYDSKSAMRAHYRAAGVREVGNDYNGNFTPPPPPQPKSNKGAVKEAFEKAGIWDDLPA